MKDFTLYPEALELKQLGFAEPCIAYYTVVPEDNINWFTISEQAITGNSSIFGSSKNYNTEWFETEGTISAPTYSQAFRWFRDNGKVAEIFSQLLPSNKYKWGFKIQGIEGVTDGFFTYEEAELACLREMIKLVKK